MSELILKNIAKHIAITAPQQELFLSLLEPKKIKKRQYFLQEGEVCKNSAFVISGCLRSYFADSNGFEHILQFAMEDWWMADMMSYTTQKPGNLFIDALEDTEVLLLSRDNQLKLFDQCPSFERYFRVITENGLVSHQRRVLENLSLPAMERYKIFAKRYPAFIQRLPQTQIASYLGITPEFLSKIRHQMMYQKP
ncbi:MAG: Crp/Fnr family transcriptional regulator [Bacteroidetes bacterium]|jgi:CRP-like cAMP-binding protein|nr:Crp/Fnr family transcriptional regulator [Bacteroidota bacterium]